MQSLCGADESGPVTSAVQRASIAAGSPVLGTTRNRRDRGGTLSGSCAGSESCPDPDRVGVPRLLKGRLHLSDDRV